jgi:hypothetical protein
MIFQKGHLVGGFRPLGHVVQGAVVIPQNQPPVAYTDSAQTAYQTPVDIDLLSNDIDLDGTLDASSVEVVTQPANGTVSINPLNGIATYTPGLEFYGVDTFEYRVADDQSAWSEPVAVSLDVAQNRRFFTQFQASGQKYMEAFADIQASNTMVWEMDICTTVGDKGPLLCFTTDNSDQYLRLIANYTIGAGTLKIESSGRTPGEGSIPINDGKIHRIKVVTNCQNGRMELFVDGVSDYVSWHSTPSELQMPRKFTVGRTRITRDDSSTGFLPKISVFNLKLTLDDVITYDVPLDEDWNQVFYADNKAFNMGGNLWKAWDKSNYNTGSGGFSNVEITDDFVEVVADGTQAYPAVFLPGFVASQGRRYLISCFMDTTNSSTRGFLGVANDVSAADGRVIGVAGGAQAFGQIVTQDSSTAFHLRFCIDGNAIEGNANQVKAGDRVRFSNIEVYEVDENSPIMEVFNFTADDCIEMSEESDGWYTDNLFTNPPAVLDTWAVYDGYESYSVTSEHGSTNVLIQDQIRAMPVPIGVVEWDMDLSASKVSAYFQGATQDNEDSESAPFDGHTRWKFYNFAGSSSRVGLTGRWNSAFTAAAIQCYGMMEKVDVEYL